MRSRAAVTVVVGGVVIVGLAACRSHTTPFNTKPPDAGVTIALYSAEPGAGYGVVDDRRWVEITGKSILLANVDPGAELESLMIEPADTTLRIGQCMRERMPDLPKKDPLEEYAEQQRNRRAEQLRRRIEVALPPRSSSAPEVVDLPPAPSDRFVPVVKCDVTAKPGRYLVRILYVTKALGFRAQHDIDVRDAQHGAVTSRFAITTPVWQTRAELVLYDGVPGGDRSPVEVARGPATLDGSTAVLATPTRDTASRILRIYAGAVVTSADSTDIMWGHDSSQEIRVWLELDKLRLAPGPVRVHIDLAGEGVRDLDVPQVARQHDDDTPGAPLRLPLWIDESLRGSRLRLVEYNDGASVTERYVFAVANLGEDARSVLVEEPMRSASRRKLDRSWPTKPTVEHNVLRTKLDLKPGRMERTGYTMTYDF
ncbi:MAG TPA: hypothetical protein VIV11_27735 [Kofleriaceae bacterium]